MIDFRRFDLNLLIIADALFDESSATAVARRLGISQPTVSFSLTKLRAIFDDPLFVRTRTGMRPTPVALSLRGPIREALDLIKTRVLPGRQFDPATSRREFRISTSDVGELCFLPDLLSALCERAPNTTLTSVSLPPAALAEAMEAGSVDLAVGYFPDLQAPDFHSERLFEHPFVVIARRNHPLTRTPLTVEAFVAADHAAVVAQGRSQELFERTLASQGLTRRIVLTTPHFMTLPSLIASTDLIAIVPRVTGTVYQPGEGLALIEPPVAFPSIVLAQHWHRRHSLDPERVWLRDLVSQLFKGRDPTMDVTAADIRG